jgi:hypothetical protein
LGLQAQRIAGRERGAEIGATRREFLRMAVGSYGFSKLGWLPSLQNMLPKSSRKAVVITFGGGARDEETFHPDGQENIPQLLHTLIPQATFFTQVTNQGILGHYVATASLATGVYERFDNFAAVSPQNPTVFEYFRKDLKRPATDTWVVAPSNGFNRIGGSDSRLYGPHFSAGVVLPKQLLAHFLADKSQDAYHHLLRDNYEAPFYSPAMQGNNLDIPHLAEVLQLSLSDFTQHALELASPDELSVFIARRIMRQYAPSLLWITLHDIDVAHAGAFSLYIEGIRRSDRLCATIWSDIQSNPEYAGKTTLFIAPDFGRDGDDTVGGNGFQHHRTGDLSSRTTWMMALGPGIRENTVVDRSVQTIDLIPTLGAILGFSPQMSHGHPLSELI